MYYRNPDYLNVEQLAKAFQTVPGSRPVNWRRGLLHSTLMFAIPAIALLLVLGIGCLTSIG